MKVSSFWPPRRTLNRVAAEYYQRRHPGVPWLSRPAIELLADLIKPTDRCLEWGAGASTVWLSRLAGSVLSIEHDKAWFERIDAQLQSSGLGRGSVRLLSTEPADQPDASPYVRVVDEFDDGDLDITLIDGEHRSACALAVAGKLSSGGILMIDDAHNFIDHPTSSPHSRWRKGPPDSDWASFAEIVGDWRLAWCSDGYSDAAIWLKP